jgi:hypothetical protein
MQGREFSSYSEYERNRVKAQTLWKVDDSLIERPELRFKPDTTPFMENILEGGSGPLEGASIPTGLILFTEDLCRMFGVGPTKYVAVNDVIGVLMSYLDYTEPYYLLVDSLVTVTNGPLHKTYRREETGSVLAPDKIETFEVQRGYNFPLFDAATKFLALPGTKAILEGKMVMHKQKNVPATKMDILEKLSEILWGSQFWLQYNVDEWISNHSDDITYTLEQKGIYNPTDVDLVLQQSRGLWLVATIASLMWLRSPYSVRFLVDSHPIYWAVLRWDETENKLKIREGSGGEAVVYGWDVYTHAHLNVSENELPGTCCCCGQQLHCTKYVNTNAIMNPICSCGEPLEIEIGSDFERYYNHSRPECEPYHRTYPPIKAFMCQRCLYVKIYKKPDNTGCGRAGCPNTSCPHHMGKGMFIRELTRNRTAMLPHIQR